MTGPSRCAFHPNVLWATVALAAATGAAFARGIMTGAYASHMGLGAAVGQIEGAFTLERDAVT